MKYVLILILIGGSGWGGMNPATSTVDFETKSACIDAQDDTIKVLKKTFQGLGFSVQCHPKGNQARHK